MVLTEHMRTLGVSCPFQARRSLVLQVIYHYSEEGGIAKMLANHLGMTSGGGWMLPVWREMGGQAVCNTHPELHGAAGVLLSDDQAGHLPSLISDRGWQQKKTPKEILPPVLPSITPSGRCQRQCALRFNANMCICTDMVCTVASVSAHMLSTVRCATGKVLERVQHQLG